MKTISSINSAVNDQLKKLVSKGLSIEEAAGCLDIDIEMAKSILQAEFDSEDAVKDDADKLASAYKARCMKALIDIGLNDNDDKNIHARIAALRTVVEYGENVPEKALDKLGEMYSRMKTVTERYDKEREEAELAKKKAVESPCTPTTIIIENTNKTKTENFDTKFEAAMSNG